MWRQKNSKYISKTLDMVDSYATVRPQSKIHMLQDGGDAFGSDDKLREMESKVEELETEVEKLSKKMEAKDKEEPKIGRTLSMVAEVVTIAAGVVALIEFLK